MNRVIKFRGKSNTGVWVYGSHVQFGNEQPIIDYVKRTHPDDGRVIETDWCYVKPETVGQFTGLTDKNSKEIYEGDILRYPPKDKIEVNNYVSYEVFWHDNDCADRHIGWQMNRYHYHGNLCGTINDFTTYLPKYTEKMIIIGNIHDNPEFMGGGEK